MVSVIIPLYNKSAYITKAVNSVLSQSYKDFELIIVNDGSTDNSLEIVQQLKDKRIVIIDQKNQGVSTARNNGVKEAKYDFVAFLDADDWWDIDFLKEMNCLITDYPSSGIYGCNYWYVKNGLNRKLNIGLPDDFQRGNIDYFRTYANTFTVPFNCSFVIVNKKIFDKVGGFNPNLKFGEDLDLWIRMALVSNVAYLNKNLAFSNQDIPGEIRALGDNKIYKKENHCIFNFKYLDEELKINNDLKFLLDGLKLRSLIRYHLNNIYPAEVKDILSGIDFSYHPKFYQFLYKYPKPIVKLFFWIKKIGSIVKRHIILAVRKYDG